jgi:hypothetical protein
MALEAASSPGTWRRIVTLDDTSGRPDDSGGFEELPGFEDSGYAPRDLMRTAMGDVVAAMALIVATLVVGVWARTAGGLVGGVALAFSVYLGVMALSGTWIACRNLSATRRLQASDELMDAVPVGRSQRLEQLIAAAEQHPDSVLAQALAAHQAWLEHDLERAGHYAQRADERHPGMHRMVMILMAVHWHQGQPGRAQQQARRLLRTRSSARAVHTVGTVLTWPWLLLPGWRHYRRRMRVNQQIDEAWVRWARWLVDKYDARTDDPIPDNLRG